MHSSWPPDDPQLLHAPHAGVPIPGFRISGVATSLGSVAFRIFFPVALPAGITMRSAPRAWLPVAIYQRLRRTWPADIAIGSRHRGDVSQDWALQGQIALVLGAEGLQEETLHRLQTARNWGTIWHFPRGYACLSRPLWMAMDFCSQQAVDERWIKPSDYVVGLCKSWPSRLRRTIDRQLCAPGPPPEIRCQ